MSTPKGWTDPVTINDNGDRIVVETTYADATRCQMIFRRDGGGWRITLCHPGVPEILLPAATATSLAYGLRQVGS